jgi:hypothetical protein
MGQMEANNYERAFNQLQGLDEALAQKLPRTINPANANYYTVVLVRKTNDVARERYITTFQIQSFNKRQLEKLQKSFVFLGYNTVIILHDPNRPSPGGAPAPEPEKELPQTPEPAPAKVEEPFDVNKARVAELREFAEDHGIELAEEDLKADIKAKIVAWQEENATEEV